MRQASGYIARPGPTRPVPIRRTLPERGGLDPVAEDTGGEILRYSLSETPDWGAILRRVRERFLAGFCAPSGSGNVRTLRVTLSARGRRACPSCIVRARRAYVAR